MPNDSLLDSVRENLNGRPGQPIVFGVCNALATRFDREPWIFRAGFLALAVFWTGFALLAYTALGLLMHETESRTRGVFVGLFITLREAVDRCLQSCQQLCRPPAHRRKGANH